LAALCIAIGNPLRRDDGVALSVVCYLAASGLKVRDVLQLTPELAAEIGGASLVVFIDADPAATEPYIVPIQPSMVRGTPLAHAMTPAEVVCLAESLYGFTGAAFLCHVPAFDFDYGERLTPLAEVCARAAALLVEKICDRSLGVAK
jgi:hydrogenase maturation protease